MYQNIDGQGLVEYGLVIMLVALVVLGSLTAFGLFTDGLFQTAVEVIP
ncbi:hypothetical protein BH23CHL1_BH23CHL1_16460 [soil metagenome]